MTVPFERLGPGQSGRLVYQVMGKNGPIFNPRNIKYLPPNSVESSINNPLDYSSAALGLSCINLLVSTGTLVLSGYTLASVRRIEKEVYDIKSDIGEIKAKLDEIAKRAEKIEISVAELNLRETLRHIFRNALSEDNINLVVLARLFTDVDNFINRLPENRSIWSLHLPTDLQDQLSYLFDTLYNLRRVVATHHNLSVKGDPKRVVSIKGSADYLGRDLLELSYFAVILRLMISIGYVSAELIADDISEGFILKDRNVEGRKFESLMRNLLVQPPFELLVKLLEPEENWKTSNILSVLFELLNRQIDSNSFSCLVGNYIFQYSEDKLGYTASEKLKNMISLNTQKFELIDYANEIKNFLEYWLWHSDEGLLIRLRSELAGLQYGYASVFWPHLLNQPEYSDLTEIKVAGLLPEPK